MKFHTTLVLVLAVALAPGLVARAENPPSAAAVPTLDKQKLKADLADLEAEVERVRRTQGEAGLHRRGLTQKLAREKAMTDFHLQLIDRLEHIEQRLSAMDARVGTR